MNLNYTVTAVFSPRYTVCRQAKLLPFEKGQPALEPDGFLMVDVDNAKILWMSPSGARVKRIFSPSFLGRMHEKSLKATFCLIDGFYYVAVLSSKEFLVLYDTNSSAFEEFSLNFPADDLVSCNHGLLLTSTGFQDGTKKKRYYLISKKFDDPILVQFDSEVSSEDLHVSSNEILSVNGSVVLCVTISENRHPPLLTLWNLEIDKVSSQLSCSPQPFRSHLAKLGGSVSGTHESGHRKLETGQKNVAPSARCSSPLLLGPLHPPPRLHSACRNTIHNVVSSRDVSSPRLDIAANVSTSPSNRVDFSRGRHGGSPLFWSQTAKQDDLNMSKSTISSYNIDTQKISLPSYSLKFLACIALPDCHESAPVSCMSTRATNQSLRSEESRDFIIKYTMCLIPSKKTFQVDATLSYKSVDKQGTLSYSSDGLDENHVGTLSVTIGLGINPTYLLSNMLISWKLKCLYYYIRISTL